jgi:hypothetical protein
VNGRELLSDLESLTKASSIDRDAIRREVTGVAAAARATEFLTDLEVVAQPVAPRHTAILRAATANSKPERGFRPRTLPSLVAGLSAAAVIATGVLVASRQHAPSANNLTQPAHQGQTLLPQTSAHSIPGGSSPGVTASAQSTGPAVASGSAPKPTSSHSTGGGASTTAAPPVAPYDLATTVWGQLGSFATNAVNRGGVSANSLNNSADVAVAADGGVYVADSDNNRVLHFATSSTTADRVYGQNGNMADTSGGQGQNAMSHPSGLAIDGSGGLYVSDTGNNRVLYFAPGSTIPSRVYGQHGSYTSYGQNQGGISAASLWAPSGLVIDGGGGLYVADLYNNRVLHFAAGATTADRVYGQNGSFTTQWNNVTGVPTANSFYDPTDVALDSHGNLYVSDSWNNRVLVFANGSTTAFDVYGQGGSYTSGSPNKGGVSTQSLYHPGAVTIAPGDVLLVTDTDNHRLLEYPSGGHQAAKVWGQHGSFSTNGSNQGGLSGSSLSGPQGLVATSAGVWLVDSANNRILHFPGA